MNYGAFALQILLNLPGLIKAGVDIKNIITGSSDTIKVAQKENRDISDAEWNAMNAQIDALRSERDEATKDIT